MSYLARNEEGNWACDLCVTDEPLRCAQCTTLRYGFKWRGVCPENTNDKPV